MLAIVVVVVVENNLAPNRSDSTHGNDPLLGQLTFNSRSEGLFRLPHWLAVAYGALGFGIRQESFKYPDGVSEAESLRLYRGRDGELLYVRFGSCHAHGARWIQILVDHEAWQQNELERPEHDCRTDHIDLWLMQSKEFDDSDAERKVKVSFVPCAFDAGKIDIHLELFGPVYEKILREANMKIPSIQELYQSDPAAVSSSESPATESSISAHESDLPVRTDSTASIAH